MKTLLILLFWPALALAGEAFDFSVSANNFKLLESSVRGSTAENVFYVQAIWEATGPDQNYRWTTYTSGCSSPSGSITVLGEQMVKTYTWSIEGSRVYDFLAVNSCLSYWKNNPTKINNVKKRL